MNNKTNKPKQTAKQLISKMKFEKGITFKYISESEAEKHLSDVNNYLRTAAYRKNYPKHTKGPNKGKYIHLDFAYLHELSIIDMHLRFIISKMCLDLEHDLKVRILKDIENNAGTDGYDIVQKFLSQNPNIIKKLEATSYSPFTSDLIFKYFSIQQSSNHLKGENKIISYNDCPAWVLLELLTFGDFIRFYAFYYLPQNSQPIPLSVLKLVKRLRNSVAHNNCILANLSKGTTPIPHEISQLFSKIPTIPIKQRRKKLSCRPMLEFTCLLYSYSLIVSDKVKFYRITELKKLFFERMLQKKGYFKNNELIKSNYQFACKIISEFFH